MNEQIPVQIDIYRQLANAACDCLNAAFKADPRAMHALICNRVPCTPELAADPNIVVDAAMVLPAGSGHLVGTLGVVVGLFRAMGFPCTVAAKYDDGADSDGRHRLLGFSVVEFDKVGDVAKVP